MTMGEMAAWTRRLRSILNGSKDIRADRLAAIMNDLEDAYGVQVACANGTEKTIICGYFAAQLHRAVKEWREV